MSTTQELKIFDDKHIRTFWDDKVVGEIGNMILTPFWAQGIGTEAVRQVCGIAFQELELDRINGQVFPENVASVRVLEKNGFRLEDVVRASAKSNNLFLDTYFQTS